MVRMVTVISYTYNINHTRNEHAKTVIFCGIDDFSLKLLHLLLRFISTKKCYNCKIVVWQGAIHITNNKPSLSTFMYFFHGTS